MGIFVGSFVGLMGLPVGALEGSGVGRDVGEVGVGGGVFVIGFRVGVAEGCLVGCQSEEVSALMR